LGDAVVRSETVIKWIEEARADELEISKLQVEEDVEDQNYYLEFESESKEFILQTAPRSSTSASNLSGLTHSAGLNLSASQSQQH
jgi:hypothetical protein